MAIHFFCTHCGHKLKAKEDLAGKKVACLNPDCRRVLRVPHPDEGGSEDTPARPKTDRVGNGVQTHSPTKTHHEPEVRSKPIELPTREDRDQQDEAVVEGGGNSTFLWMGLVVLALAIVEGAIVALSSPTKSADALAVVLLTSVGFLALRGCVRGLFRSKPLMRSLALSILAIAFITLVASSGRTFDHKGLPYDLPSGLTYFHKDKVGELILLVFKFGCIYLVGLALAVDFNTILDGLRRWKEGRTSRSFDTGRQGFGWQVLRPLRALTRVFAPYRLAPYDEDAGPVTVEKLQPIRIRSNWNPGKIRLPNFLIRERGPLLESIVADLAGCISRQDPNRIQQGWVAEAQNERARYRSLRVMCQLLPGHVTSTDVYFQAQGKDLYVRFDTKSWSWIVVLSRTLKMAVGLGLFLLGTWAYFGLTGARQSWAKEYAAKHVSGKDQTFAAGGTNIAQGLEVSILHGSRSINLEMRLINHYRFGRNDIFFNEIDMFESLMNRDGTYTINPNCLDLDEALSLSRRYNLPSGYIWSPGATTSISIEHPNTTLESYYKACLDQAESGNSGFLNRLKKQYSDPSTISSRPWSLWDLFRNDPKLGLLNQGLIPILLAFGSAAVAFLLPTTLLHGLCRSLGWPTPDVFGNTVQAHKTQVESLLSDVLLQNYEVHEGDKFDVAQ